MTEIVEAILSRLNSSSRGKRPGQYTYVIGNNGTGKSRMLGELAERLKKARSDRVVACIASSVHDRFTYGDHKNVIYMGARNSSNAVFLSAIDRQLARYILHAMRIDRRLLKYLLDAVNMNLSFSISEKSIDTILNPPEKATRDSNRIIKRAADLGLLSSRPIAMLRRIAEGSGRFEKLTEAQIPMLLNYLELNIDFTLKIELAGGELIGFDELSTGEQNRLLLFSKILSVMRDGTIFLIDEPEISLHLHWQMDFHKTLEKLLSRLNRFHVVVATHSPTIISEAVKVDADSLDNMVAVLHREHEADQRLTYAGPGAGSITCKFHNFAEVASHDQLVLRFFQTSPYQTREVSVEVADAVLSVAEGGIEKNDAVKLLSELRTVIGLSKEAEQQIEAALVLVRNDLVNSIKMKDVP
ncbi:AAA family ATPase [Pseudomonas shirazica]|uniref:AAA family ATPase n=1 Tax=Pseudomonas shirazica TaxID=1940636 RepID=A0ABY9SLQ0_9PSED|nr:AAA family ATPase [Pseudomonas shirazica]WMY84511.1 AAA family ATPase [Pseudomonas shirazica]